MKDKMDNLQVKNNVLPGLGPEPESPKFGTKNPLKGAGKYGQSQIAFIKQAPNTQKSEQTITLAQLSKHKSKQSAWISLKGIVYDVTQYLKHHPGGDILIEGCGCESQKLFNEHHSWVNAKNILAKWVVGRLQQ